MSGYIASFTVYTLAMVGVIFLALVVAKKAMNFKSFKSRGEQFLNIESSLDLGPRKTIYVLRAGEEKFLVASDPEHTSFLTKLNAEKADKDKTTEVSNVSYLADLPDISAISHSGNADKPFMKELLRKLNV